jgi:hypothetical protein
VNPAQRLPRAESAVVAQECIGDGRWLLQKGIDYAKEWVVFDRPIGQNQGVQFPLARAYAELEAADMICRRAAALFDAGAECGADANTAKLLAADATWHAAEATMQTYGGFPFAREYDIERKWREARLYQTAPISTNLILAYIGQHVLGLPRSYPLFIECFTRSDGAANGTALSAGAVAALGSPRKAPGQPVDDPDEAGVTSAVLPGHIAGARITGSAEPTGSSCTSFTGPWPGSAKCCRTPSRTARRRSRRAAPRIRRQGRSRRPSAGAAR